jgi:hypothetical protein
MLSHYDNDLTQRMSLLGHLPFFKNGARGENRGPLGLSGNPYLSGLWKRFLCRIIISK